MTGLASIQIDESQRTRDRLSGLAITIPLDLFGLENPL